MPNITEFRTAIRSGLVRQHKWRVIFNFPAFASTSEVARQASLQARTANIPSSTLGVMEVPYGGRVLPLPGDRQYEEFTTNFIAVNDHKVRDALERWSENINGSESNIGLANLEDYMRDVVLEMLDNNDNVTKTYVLKDAWPVIIGQSDLDQGSQDSFVEFPVTWRFINYESNTTL